MRITDVIDVEIIDRKEKWVLGNGESLESL